MSAKYELSDIDSVYVYEPIIRFNGYSLVTESKTYKTCYGIGVCLTAKNKSNNSYYIVEYAYAFNLKKMFVRTATDVVPSASVWSGVKWEEFAAV